MELIKTNKEKSRRVYKGLNFYRKEWLFEDHNYFKKHLEKLFMGY